MITFPSSGSWLLVIYKLFLEPNQLGFKHMEGCRLSCDKGTNPLIVIRR